MRYGWTDKKVSSQRILRHNYFHCVLMKAVNEVLAHYKNLAENDNPPSSLKPRIKRFSPSDAQFFHRMIQSVNREQYSSKTVFTINLHVGILNEWLKECVIEEKIHFPICGLLELIFATGAKSRLLFNEDDDPDKQLVVTKFKLLKDVCVSVDSSALTCLFCSVADSGEVEVLQKSEKGKNDLICQCMFLPRDESRAEAPIDRAGLKELPLSRHAVLKKSYFVPPLLLQELLALAGVSSSISEVSAFWIDRSHLEKLWLVSVGKYRVAAQGSTKIVELLTYEGKQPHFSSFHCFIPHFR